MSDPTNREDDTLESALFPYEIERERALRESGRLLAHYTTAEVAQSIISNAEVWLRNALAMNDFSEIQHGRECLDYVAERKLLQKLLSIVDAAHPDLGREILQRLSGGMNSLVYDTYITCLSEFAAPTRTDGTRDPDHEYGRLSMWRAYGRDNGVALLFDPKFVSEQGNLGNIFTSPVYYGDKKGFAEQFERVVDRVAAIPEVLKTCTRADLLDRVFNALRFSMLSVKHPAFKEEEEWRIIYTPGIGGSRFVEKAVKLVRGVPQVVHVLKLVDDIPNGIRAAPASLIHEVLVGPCEFPMLLRQTFFHELREAGVQDPSGRIRNSGIPLRR